MIRIDGSPDVYLIIFCEMRWIPNPPTLDGLFNSWKIRVFKKSPNIPKGPGISNGSLLIKSPKQNTVYLHTDGKKYPIANPTTFDKFNFDWSKIHVIPLS